MALGLPCQSFIAITPSVTAKFGWERSQAADAGHFVWIIRGSSRPAFWVILGSYFWVWKKIENIGKNWTKELLLEAKATVDVRNSRNRRESFGNDPCGIGHLWDFMASLGTLDS
jgi:hypothetical protein